MFCKTVRMPSFNPEAKKKITHQHDSVRRQRNPPHRQRRDLRNPSLRARKYKAHPIPGDDLAAQELGGRLGYEAEGDAGGGGGDGGEEDGAAAEAVLEEAGGDGAEHGGDVVHCTPEGLPVGGDDGHAVDEDRETHPVGKVVRSLRVWIAWWIAGATYWKAGIARQTDSARFSYPTMIEPTRWCKH